ncbi:MAG: hypothetical protein JXA43_00945, partial [Candidatus Diapherotrites archaeon]|nr:hypothetical protein [Candidatus Diapherotrites archaeon]
MIQDYTDLANFLISYSKDPCEVFISGNTHEQVTAKDSRLSGVEINSSLGAGIRVIHKGKLGFAFTQEMTKEGFKKALLTAQVIARNKGEPAQIKEFP